MGKPGTRCLFPRNMPGDHVDAGLLTSGVDPVTGGVLSAELLEKGPWARRTLAAFGSGILPPRLFSSPHPSVDGMAIAMKPTCMWDLVSGGQWSVTCAGFPGGALYAVLALPAVGHDRSCLPAKSPEPPGMPGVLVLRVPVGAQRVWVWPHWCCCQWVALDQTSATNGTTTVLPHCLEHG